MYVVELETQTNGHFDISVLLPVPVKVSGDDEKDSPSGVGSAASPSPPEGEGEGEGEAAAGAAADGGGGEEFEMISQHIRGSPFKMYSRSAAVDLKKCSITSGRKRGDIGSGPQFVTTAGYKQTFTISTVDMCANVMADGGEAFSVRLMGPSQEMVRLVDNNDGTYCAEFQVCLPPSLSSVSLSLCLSLSLSVCLLPQL
jgi:hypothetical protein